MTAEQGRQEEEQEVLGAAVTVETLTAALLVMEGWCQEL